MFSTEKSILFLARVLSKKDEFRPRMHAWFTISPRGSVKEVFSDLKLASDSEDRSSRYSVDCELSGVSCALFGPFLLAVGGRNDFFGLIQDRICYLDTRNLSQNWNSWPSRPCTDSIVCVYKEWLYIFPGESQSPLNQHVDYLNKIELLKSPPPDGIHIYNCKTHNVETISKLPSSVIRGCAALEDGILVAVDGDKNFYCHKPGQDEFVVGGNYQRLPQFKGNTAFTVLNDKLFILDVTEESVVLFAISVHNGEQMLKETLLQPEFENFDVRCWGSPKLVAVSDNTLCVLFPTCHSDTSPFISRVKIVLSKEPLAVENVTMMNFIGVNYGDKLLELVDCLPIDLHQLGMASESEPESEADCQPCHAARHNTGFSEAKKGKSSSGCYSGTASSFYVDGTNVYDLLCSKCQDQAMKLTQSKEDESGVISDQVMKDA